MNKKRGPYRKSTTLNTVYKRIHRLAKLFGSKEIKEIEGKLYFVCRLSERELARIARVKEGKVRGFKKFLRRTGTGLVYNEDYHPAKPRKITKLKTIICLPVAEEKLKIYAKAIPAFGCNTNVPNSKKEPKTRNAGAHPPAFLATRFSYRKYNQTAKKRMKPRATAIAVPLPQDTARGRFTLGYSQISSVWEFRDHCKKNSFYDDYKIITRRNGLDWVWKRVEDQIKEHGIKNEIAAYVRTILECELANVLAMKFGYSHGYVKRYRKEARRRGLSMQWQNSDIKKCVRDGRVKQQELPVEPAPTVLVGIKIECEDEEERLARILEREFGIRIPKKEKSTW